MTGRTRHAPWLAVGAAVWTLSLAGLTATSAAAAHPQKAATGSPIVIGFLDTMSGPLAEVGDDTLTGAQIAVQQINAAGGVLGHPLKIEVKNEELSPTVTVEDMRQYASQHVSFITGFTSSADCYAAAPIAAKNDMVIVSSACSDNGLQTTDFNPHLFTVASNTMQMALAAAHYVVAHDPQIKVWDNMSYDYVTGHAFWSDFQAAIKKLDPSVKFGKSVFFPLTATQVTSYVTALLATLPANSQKSYGLFLGTFGSGTVETAQQGRPYGLFQKFGIVLNVSGSEPTSATLGPTGPAIFYVQDYYYKAYHTPMNEALVTAYDRLKNHPKFAGPDLWVEQGYTSIQVIAQAIEHAKSLAVPKVMAALTDTRFTTPKGTAYIRSDHTMMSPETVWECVGSAKAKIGYTCPIYVSIPTNVVAPPVLPH